MDSRLIAVNLSDKIIVNLEDTIEQLIQLRYSTVYKYGVVMDVMDELIASLQDFKELRDAEAT